LTYFLGASAIGSGIIYMISKDGMAALEYGVEIALDMFLFGHFQKITATGDVILFGTDQEVIHKNQQGLDQGVIHKNQQGLEGAISKAIETLTKSLPQNSNIAILNMEASDISTAKYAVDELEFQLVNSKKFIIVDRLRIDQIRNEQKIQLSGDVDDNSAVSIGKILGANIVITGSISGSGNSKRLFLRVLNVQTSQIIAMVREDF